MGVLRLAAWLPLRSQHTVGAWLGLRAMRFMPRRRHIVDTNLRLCFPEWDEATRTAQVRAHFAALGIGLLELADAWWATDAKLRAWVNIQGLEHLDAGLAKGRGVLLLSAHFSNLELGARLLLLHRAIHGVYRPHENPVLNWLMTRNRERYAEAAIPRDDVRAMMRCLKKNGVLWFAPDQNFGHKHSVFADFFGVPAATNTATARLAEMTGAAVVPFFCHRLPHGQGYRITLQPALEDFPATASPDWLQQATQRVNHVIEDAIRQAPEQYFWVHRRFKDRPPGAPDVYAR